MSVSQQDVLIADHQSTVIMIAKFPINCPKEKEKSPPSRETQNIFYTPLHTAFKVVQLLPMV